MTTEPTTHHTPDALATVLHALRDAEPTPGFNTRLLQTLATHQLAGLPKPTLAQRFRHLLTRPSSPTHRWRAVVAAIILVAALTAGSVSLHRRPFLTIANPSHTAIPNSSLSPDLSARPNAPFALSSRRDPLLAQHPARATHRNTPPRITTPDPTTLARLETAAPSHPAPPLPVTPEELAFQRFVSRENAVSLAALTPAAERAHETADQRDFNTFFPPPPPPELLNPPPTTTAPTAPPPAH